MSVPVPLEELWARVAEYGAHPYLVTTSGSGHPHVVSVPVRVEGDRLAVTAGRTSTANAAANPSVTLLWPPRDGGPYSLLVDGEADEALAVRPLRAVLHRVAGADDVPSCVPILDRA